MSRSSVNRSEIERGLSETAPDYSDGFDPLADPRPPAQWTAEWVGYRLTEAFRVLARLPMRLGPAQPGSTMPAYLYDQADLNAQAERTAEQVAAGVDITEALRETQERANRSRTPPTAVELSLTDEALRWCMRFELPPLDAACVQTWAVARALDLNLGKLSQRRLGMTRDTISARARAVLGTLARRLHHDRVPVR